MISTGRYLLQSIFNPFLRCFLHDQNIIECILVYAMRHIRITHMFWFVSYHSLLWCMSSMALHTKRANPLGKQKKTKKPKAPSQNHSKTIEKTGKNQKNQRSEQLGGWWGGGGAHVWARLGPTHKGRKSIGKTKKTKKP